MMNFGRETLMENINGYIPLEIQFGRIMEKSRMSVESLLISMRENKKKRNREESLIGLRLSM